MSDVQPIAGIVHSHTVINLPGRAHAAAAPFVLLLVDTGKGRHVLGHFSGAVAPSIGTRVVTTASRDGTPIFSIAQGTT